MSQLENEKNESIDGKDNEDGEKDASAASE